MLWLGKSGVFGVKTGQNGALNRKLFFRGVEKPRKQRIERIEQGLHALSSDKYMRTEKAGKTYLQIQLIFA